MMRRARAEFPAYFAAATPGEARIMDAAYVGAQAYRKAVQTPRPRPEDPVRQPLEVMTFNAEQLLLHVRDALRESDAYMYPRSRDGGHSKAQRSRASRSQGHQIYAVCVF
jgi:hypothetical protein